MTHRAFPAKVKSSSIHPEAIVSTVPSMMNQDNASEGPMTQILRHKGPNIYLELLGPSTIIRVAGPPGRYSRRPEFALA